MLSLDECKSRLEKFTAEQQEVIHAVKEGKSLFVTGDAGTGKSYLLRGLYELIPLITDKHIVFTSMTGCAALLLGKWAKTLHSWSGIGLGRDSVAVLAVEITRSWRAYRRWRGADILVVDEVSMMTPEILEKLDAVAKIIRKDKSPMGGLQVIFTGDFYQLPPVYKDKANGTPFVFESPLWNEIVQETIQLTKIHRQDDPVFQKILMEARRGQLSKESSKILESRMNLPWQELKIRPTLLFSRRAEVDVINQRNLKALKSDKKIYKAETVFVPIKSTQHLTKASPEIKYAVEKLDRDGSYMPELILGIGAQVMLLTNLSHDEGLVNGSRGVVVDFDVDDTPIVEFKGGKKAPIVSATWFSEDIDGLCRKQIPLKLAYALTIHKAQGATLDCALIDIGRSTFEYGQAYVALSRVKNLESLYLWDFEPSAFRAHPKVAEYYKSLSGDDDDPCTPD